MLAATPAPADTHPSRLSRTTARLLVVGLLAAVLVPFGNLEVHAVPVTLSEVLTDVPEQASDAVGLASAGAPGDPAATVSRSEPIEAPLRFSAVGVRVPDTVTELRVRTAIDDQWSPWELMELLDEEDGPDTGTAEDRAARPGQHTAPLWVEDATHLQFEVVGASVSDIEPTIIDSMGLSGGPMRRVVESGPSPADASGLNIISRAQWGADESLNRSRPSYARDVHIGVVHHTAHTSSSAANTYSREQAAGIMRAMHRYHTQSLGWSDLGYNVVVDRFGRIYEGRAGGLERGVIGAHARGYNTGSFGVAVIGNFVNAAPSTAAIDALIEVVALKSAIHGIDPAGTTNAMADGRWRQTIVGHRDVGQTSCPGRIHGQLPSIRTQAAAREVIRFPDVPLSSPHRSSILELAEQGVTSGCRLNSYCPRDGLNRAQASTFVVNALQLRPVSGTRFPDVPADATHGATINALAERGWLQGYPDGTFRPWEQLTRGQLATLLANSLDLPLYPPWSDPYPDVPRTATHAPAIAALKELGIRGDCGGGNFCPNDVALRDSTASFVLMVRTIRFPPPPPPEPEDIDSSPVPPDELNGTAGTTSTTDTTQTTP